MVNPKNLSTSFLFLGLGQSSISLMKAMVRAPVLALTNATDPFILDTDASDKSVGAELIQIQEGERAVAYGSLTLTPEQQKYCTTRKKLLAITQKPLHLLFILRPWPVFYIFDIPWPDVHSSRSNYST
jgi:hypothetical protein